MTVRYRQVDNALAALNPVPPTTGGSSIRPLLDQRARIDLRDILATDPDAAQEPGPGASLLPAGFPRRRMPLRFAVPASVAALSALALVIVPLTGLGGGAGQQNSGLYAAAAAPLAYTPIKDSDPKDLLKSIAARTAALPDDTGTGRYRHLETQGWYLNTSVSHGQGTSWVEPQRNSTWVAEDGSGRLVRTSTSPGGATQHEDERLAPGELSVIPPYPANPAALKRILDRNTSPNGPFDAIRTAYLDQPLPPAVRAAMLRYLGEINDLKVAGEVTDRAGRRGIGFSLDSDAGGLPTRETLIFDPDTGKLLGDEEILTKDAGKLNVRIPSVISYTVFLSARYTNSLK